MNATQPAPLFGVSIDPTTRDPQGAFARARRADEAGLDLITLMDHPYNPDIFETWTLLTALGMATRRVHIGTNVFTTPLRPPAMLAKAAATLDALTGGRLELGVGAGAFLEGIASFGGPTGSPADRHDAFAEALEILRGMWANAGGSFSYEGRFHRLRDARPGPAPARAIRIWTGAGGPRMLRLTGRLADGLLLSTTYVRPDQLPEYNRLVDEGAAQAGRDPSAIRRGYNLMGVIELDGGRVGARLRARQPGLIAGPVAYWVEELVRFSRDGRQDTFIFWPVAGDDLAQVDAFAREVAPAVRERVGG